MPVRSEGRGAPPAAPPPRFWRQPSARYRNFQIAYTLLALNFVIPAFSYSFLPDVAVAQFLSVQERLGGAPYLGVEGASHLWRYLGAANVMTLGFTCLLLQFDLRRYHAALVPLTFMKLYAATSWLVGWAVEPGYRFFLAFAVLDYVTSAAFVYFARGAHRDIATLADDQLVPRPGWGVLR